MKNVLQYYYNLKPETIHQKDSDFRFSVNGTDYLLKKIDDFNEELYELYELNVYLLKNNILFNQIMLNFENKIATYVNGNLYILLKLHFSPRKIKTEDIVSFGRLNLDLSKFKKLNRSNWHTLWSNIVDYIEYQNSQFGKKYPIIRESVNYYIGMAENAISLVENVKEHDFGLTISRRRIRNTDTLFDLYNPLGIVVDSRIRDIGEYYKNKFFTNFFSFEEMKKVIISYKISSDEAMLLMARMLYPSYYFDCYQKIVYGYIEEKTLYQYINKCGQYEELLKELYLFLRNYYNIPEIEWIIKT